MNHLELKAARETLRLTPQEAAQMLDMATAKPIYRMEMDPANSTAIEPSARVVRLYKAYLAGYRPDDWPTRLVEEAERLKMLEDVRTQSAE